MTLNQLLNLSELQQLPRCSAQWGHMALLPLAIIIIIIIITTTIMSISESSGLGRRGNQYMLGLLAEGTSGRRDESYCIHICIV